MASLRAASAYAPKTANGALNVVFYLLAVVSIILPFILFPPGNQEKARKNGVWGTKLILLMWAVFLGPSIISIASKYGLSKWVFGNVAIFIVVFLGWVYDYFSFFQDQTRYSEEKLCATGNCRTNSNITGIAAMSADVMALVEAANNIKIAISAGKTDAVKNSASNQLFGKRTRAKSRFGMMSQPYMTKELTGGPKPNWSADPAAITQLQAKVRGEQSRKNTNNMRTMRANAELMKAAAGQTARKVAATFSASMKVQYDKFGPLGISMIPVVGGMIYALWELYSEWKNQGGRKFEKDTGRGIKSSYNDPDSRRWMSILFILIVLTLLYCIFNLFKTVDPAVCSCRPLYGASVSTTMFAMMWVLGVGIIITVNEVWSNLGRFCTTKTQDPADNGYKCKDKGYYLDMEKVKNFMSKVPDLRYGGPSFRGRLNLGLSFINIFTAWQTIAQYYVEKSLTGEIPNNIDAKINGPAGAWGALFKTIKIRDFTYIRDVILLTLIFPTFTNYINTSFQFTGLAKDLKLPSDLNGNNKVKIPKVEVDVESKKD